jgi:hypothetical protein
VNSAYHLSRSNGARKSNSANLTHWREVEWRGLCPPSWSQQSNKHLSHRSTKSVWPHAIAVERKLIAAQSNKMTHNGFDSRDILQLMKRDFQSNTKDSTQSNCQEMLLAKMQIILYANLHVAIQNIFHVCFMFHVKR